MALRFEPTTSRYPTAADDELSVPVSQASGIISVQAECTVGEALVILKERALVSGTDLLDLADATIAHRIRFGPS